MVGWNSLNINCIVILSTVASTIQIIATGIYILCEHLEEMRILRTCSNCPTLIVIQGSKITVLMAHVINNALFISAVRKVNGKCMIGSMLVNMVLSLIRDILNFVNIFTTLRNINTFPAWMQIEIHPLGIFCIQFLSAGIFVAHSYWLVGFCWKNRIIRGTDKIFRLKIKTFLYSQIAFMLMHIISLVWLRTKVYTDAGIRNKVAYLDPLYFATSSLIMFYGVMWALWYFYDVILALRKNSYERLRRYYRMACITAPVYHPLHVLLFVQEKHIFDTDFNDVFWKFLIGNLIGVYVLGIYLAVFLYFKYLKHEGRDEAFKKNSCNGQSDIRIISMKRIKVDSKTPIGSGHSSFVYTGILQSSRVFWRKRKERAVAIKVLVGNHADPEMASVLAEELKNMSRVMRHHEIHPNLVVFHGACFQNSDSIIRPLGGINIIMELCENGSLDSYLLKMNDALNDRPESGTNISERYSTQLYSWAEQVAKGMEFLSGQNIIHGDLAARNILLDGKLAAKISDFGMSRKLYSYQIYISTQQAVFPWRWMAPESLDGLKFSKYSDVWSYGVLLWELFSMGGSPWSDKIWTSDFVTWLISGNRLPKTVFASGHVYNEIMLQCWKTKMEERPTFSVILERLANRHTDDTG